MPETAIESSYVPFCLLLDVCKLLGNRNFCLPADGHSTHSDRRQLILTTGLQMGIWKEKPAEAPNLGPAFLLSARTSSLPLQRVALETAAFRGRRRQSGGSSVRRDVESLGNQGGCLRPLSSICLALPII